MGHLSPLLLGLAALIALPIASDVMLRWAGFTAPGRAIVAGLLAGLLLGPTILGRLAPDFHERAFLGGVTEQHELRSALGRHGAEELVAQHAHLDSDQLRDLADRQARERADLEIRWHEARWRDQAPLRLVTFTVIAAVLLSAGIVSIHNHNRSRDLISPISIGLWSAALPGILAFLLMTIAWERSIAEAVFLAAAVAIGPWMLTVDDRRAADLAEQGGSRLIQTAGCVASLCALTAVAWVMHHQRGIIGLIHCLPLLALPLGWLIGPRLAAIAPKLPHRLDSLCCAAMLPILAASVAVRIDLHDSLTLALGPLLIIPLLSDDGRWLGAIIGALLPGGRPVLRSMRLVIGSMAAGPTQLAIAALATHTHVLPESLLLPLLLGAALIELSAPVRRLIAGHLIAVENELDDDGHPS